MNDKDKTKAQLIEELAALRQQVEGVDETFASSSDPLSGPLDLQTLAQRNRALESEIAKRERTEETLLRGSKSRVADNAIRVAIASMDQPEDLCRVVEEIGTQLQQMDVVYDSCAVQIVNAEATDFVSISTVIPEDWFDEVMAFFLSGSRNAPESNLA